VESPEPEMARGFFVYFTLKEYLLTKFNRRAGRVVQKICTFA